jgi:hypothetical protein
VAYFFRELSDITNDFDTKECATFRQDTIEVENRLKPPSIKVAQYSFFNSRFRSVFLDSNLLKDNFCSFKLGMYFSKNTDLNREFHF